MTIEAIIFYLLLIDSVSANVLAFCGETWYAHHFRHISRWFPIAKGWTIYYLVLVVWIGTFLYRAGSLGF